MEGVIDVQYTSLTSQGIQHRVFYLDDHPSRYQPRPTGLNFGEQTETRDFPLVIVVPLQTSIQFNRIHHEENRISPSLSLVVLSVREEWLLVSLLSRSASRVPYVKETKHRFSLTYGWFLWWAARFTEGIRTLKSSWEKSLWPQFNNKSIWTSSSLFLLQSLKI